jgi:hypothetical protein
LIMLSKTPPKCGPTGGFQCHFTPSLAVLRLIFSWSRFSTRLWINLASSYENRSVVTQHISWPASSCYHSNKCIHESIRFKRSPRLQMKTMCL